jgi:hypothetical protein
MSNKPPEWKLATPGPDYKEQGMQEIIKKIVAGLMVAGFALVCATAHAALKTTGAGASTGIEAAGFPPEMAAAYKLMEVKCKKCHSLERTVVAIQTGLGPISGEIFDKSSTEAYGVKMMRMPDSGMSKEEVKEVVSLLNFLVDLAAK